MPSLILPQVPSGLSLEELSDIVAKLSKEIEWIGNGFLDSKNIRNIAGFNVSNTELKHISGIVGMSGGNPSTATAVRFWAGHSTPASAPFQVLQDGTVKSTKGNIGGFIIGATSLIDVAGTFGLSSAVTVGDDVRFFAGGTDPTTAPFRVTESGVVNASNIAITGGSINVGTDARIGNILYLKETDSTGTKGIIFDTNTGSSAEISVLTGDIGISADGFVTITTGSAMGLVVNGDKVASETLAKSAGFNLSYNSTTKDLTLKNYIGSTISTVNLT